MSEGYRKITNRGNLCLKLATFSLIPPLLAFLWWMGTSSSNMAAPVVVNASAKHTATVIFFHGLGDTGHGWSQAFNQIKHDHIKYVCPTANIQPVTLNAGFKMPSWFDIRSLEANAIEDESGIKEAADILQNYIEDEEKKGIPRNRIMVGGFSQGGAVALYSALNIAKPSLAGILGLSTWLPLHKTFPGALKANQNTPILQCHGEADPLVQFAIGSMTSKLLQSFNNKHTFKSYKHMGHSSCEEELQDVKTFIGEHLPPI